MTTQEVANKLVEMCNKGDFGGAVGVPYSQDIVSVAVYKAVDGKIAYEEFFYNM